MENADEPFCPVVKALSNHLVIHDLFLPFFAHIDIN